MQKITKLTLSGFKTIAKIENLEFDSVNIFIGANGSGKSNIVSFFEMIGYMMTNSFRNYVANNGFASSMLYHGHRVTNTIESNIQFHSSTGTSDYKFRISHTVSDGFLFMDETIIYHKKGQKIPFKQYLDDGGYKESKLGEMHHSNARATTAKYIKNLLAGIRVFHFHDTSKEAYIHQATPIEFNSKIKSDGGNIASFLYKLKNDHSKYYERIVSYIKFVAPFFDDFILEPSGNSIQLKFKEMNSDLELGSFRLSDGTVRFICLATLLLQPKESMPKIIIIDEPELGLHPVAIDVLAEMLNIASHHAQIFLTTQSERLINHFEPKNIIVINRKKDHNGRFYSDFTKLSNDSLKDWIQDYSMSEIWNSNIIGGRP